MQVKKLLKKIIKADETTIGDVLFDSSRGLCFQIESCKDCECIDLPGYFYLDLKGYTGSSVFPICDEKEYTYLRSCRQLWKGEHLKKKTEAG